MYHHVSTDTVDDAYVDSILEFGRHPEWFDPCRGVPLEPYLHLAARRNLDNSLKSQVRRPRRGSGLCLSAADASS
jgi:hypothetical protein